MSPTCNGVVPHVFDPASTASRLRSTKRRTASSTWCNSSCRLPRPAALTRRSRAYSFGSVPEWKPGRSSRGDGFAVAAGRLRPQVARLIGPVQTPVLLELPHQKAEDAGDARADANATVAARAGSIVSARARAAAGTKNVSTSLCDTVTTGKCLIGLICGSTSRLTQKRTT